MSMTLRELAERIGATMQLCDQTVADRRIDGCASLDAADEHDVAFLANPKYAAQFAASRAAAVIVASNVANDGKNLLVADDPYFAFRNAMVELYGWREHPPVVSDQATLHASVQQGLDEGRISDKAMIHPTARIGADTQVHPFAVIGRGVTVGSNCIIYPHTFIGPDAEVGDACLLYPNVTIYERCVLGDRVTLHSSCVIGQDGFGYATHGGAHHKIPLAGNAVIEDDVEMGAHCSVDRATMGSTVIGQGSKFSNGVTIGHGSQVGKHNLVVALVGLAGSVHTGDYVSMGGQVGVAGHLKIGDRAQIAAQSGVMMDVPADASVGGTPAHPLSDAKRVALHAMRLPDLVARLRKLERELERLKNNGD